MAHIAIVGTKCDLVFEHEVAESNAELRERMGVERGPAQIATNRAVS